MVNNNEWADNNVMKNADTSILCIAWLHGINTGKSANRFSLSLSIFFAFFRVRTLSDNKSHVRNSRRSALTASRSRTFPRSQVRLPRSRKRLWVFAKQIWSLQIGEIDWDLRSPVFPRLRHSFATRTAELARMDIEVRWEYRKVKGCAWIWPGDSMKYTYRHTYTRYTGRVYHLNIANASVCRRKKIRSVLCRIKINSVWFREIASRSFNCETGNILIYTHDSCRAIKSESIARVTLSSIKDRTFYERRD